MLTNKEIEFLDDLEIRLQHQTVILNKGPVKGRPRRKDLITNEEFEQFYDILDKIHADRDRRRAKAKETMAERRKTDKNYGRPYAQKQ